jgi:hypothetical protein
MRRHSLIPLGHWLSLTTGQENEEDRSAPLAPRLACGPFANVGRAVLLKRASQRAKIMDARDILSSSSMRLISKFLRDLARECAAFTFVELTS